METQERFEELSKIMTHEIKVKKVKINGLTKVKGDIITPYLAPLLSQDNLAKLLDKIIKAKAGLAELQAFDAIDVMIEKGEERGDGGVHTVNLQVKSYPPDY